MNKGAWLNRTILTLPCNLCLCLSEEAFKKEIRRLRFSDTSYIIDNSHATTHFLEKKGGDCTVVVCLGDVSDLSDDEILATLVHEAVHIWQWVVEYWGEDNAGKEIEAYCIQAISFELITAYKKMALIR